MYCQQLGNCYSLNLSVISFGGQTMSWARRHHELSSSLIANSHSRQSKCYSSLGHGMPMLQLAMFSHQIQSTCSAAARMNGPQCDMVLPTLIAGQCYHRLLPASVFASCVMVLSEIPPFSSVANTTVLWASTPFSTSCPSSVVLSNCRPSSARCGSASILGIVVVANFYTSTSSIQYSRPFTRQQRVICQITNAYCFSQHSVTQIQNTWSWNSQIKYAWLIITPRLVFWYHF